VYKRQFPASLSAGRDNVLSVAGLNFTERLVPLPSLLGNGGAVSVAAPGWVYTLQPNQGYAVQGGSSFATPLVAGLAGLLISQDASRTPAQVKQWIIDGSRDEDLNGTANGVQVTGEDFFVINAEKSFELALASSSDLDHPLFIEGDPGTAGDGQSIVGSSYTIGFLRTATRYNPDPYPFLPDGADTITLTVYAEAPVLGYESYIYFGLNGNQCDFVLRTIDTRVTQLNLPEPENIPGIYGEVDVAQLLADFSSQGCSGSASDLYVRQVQVSAFFGGDLPLDAFAIGNGAQNVLEYVPAF